MLLNSNKGLTKKEFRKLMSKYKKEFKKKCKYFKIYDWEYTHELLVFIITWMNDFLCNNPESFADEDWIKERCNEFELVLKEQEKYIGYDRLSTLSDSLAIESKIMTEEKEINGKIFEKCRVVKSEVKDESLKKRADMYRECSDVAFEAFYVLLGKCLRNWWD